MTRKAKVDRDTKETKISVKTDLDGRGISSINTPIKFMDHMLEAFSKHSLIDLEIELQGDIEIDQHHSIEDLGIVLGEAIRQALGDKKGINRSGFFIYPMDEALATVAVDLGGRPYLQFDAQFRRRYCGDLDTDLIEHFFEAFSNALKGNVVIRLEAGNNDHHKLEAIFKALAKAMKVAVEVDPRRMDDVPSTKGVID